MFISKEQQYIKDLDFIEEVHHRPRDAHSNHKVGYSHIRTRFSFVPYEMRTLPSSLKNSSKKSLVISSTCASATRAYSR